MKSLAAGCFIAAAVAACARERLEARYCLDLLTRTPEEHGEALGGLAAPTKRGVRLGHEASVRYRIELLGPGSLEVAARAGGRGSLEASWCSIDRATGAATTRESRRIEATETGELAGRLACPTDGTLLELRLTWSAVDGEAALELDRLELVESTPAERPSIVLIVIDTLSAQHLSLYGYPLETDPELKRFASEAFVFERCFSNAPWTVPSFMALMTGLYARAHEFDPVGPELWDRWYLARNRWTLAESLRAAGYRTAGFIDNGFLSAHFGFAQGFDLYDDSASREFPVMDADPDGGIRQTASRAREFLRSLEGSPCFLFLHAFDVHQPYKEKPSPEERARGTEPYDLDHRAPAGGTGWTYDIVPTVVARVAVPTGELPNPMHTASFVRAYDEGIRFLDVELGKFFDHLRDTGVLARSWVVFTADHGETMADGVHYFGHGLLSQDVMHVPLLVRPPGGVPGGKRIAEVVQLADLYPTLVELAGFETRDIPLHGRSLVPLFEGEARAPDVVLAESGITRQAMLVADGWKLVELELTRDTLPEARLSHPLLTRDLASVERRLLEQVAEYKPPDREAPRRARHTERRFAWIEDLELRRDYFERMPETGLTEELLQRMQSRAGFKSFLKAIDRLLRDPLYELYHLDVDPLCTRDVAAENSEKVTEMRALLEQEKRRRAEAWQLAERPAQPLELPPEHVQALQALGYGGVGGDDDDDDDDDE